MSDQVLSGTQKIIVKKSNVIGVVKAGPIGPPGPVGPPGPPGVDAETNVETVVTTHINDTTPHPVYDDIVDLVVLFENGLY